MLNWNFERWRTRDRLLNHTFNIIPAQPTIANLPYIFPWENQSLSTLSRQILEIAKKNGFCGSEKELWSYFSSGHFIIGTIDTFPTYGDPNCLYLDKETGILYYFQDVPTSILPELFARIDFARIGYNTTGSTYLYIPAKTIPIDNLIYNSGDAAEYIG